MVTQINPKGSIATDVALVPLVPAKPQSVQEQPRTAKLAKLAELADSRPSEVAGRPNGPSAKELEAAVQAVNGHLERSGSKLEIDYDKASGRNVFKVVDPSTGGVVFQIPSEEILAAARKLRETANNQNTSGVLVDKEG